MKNPAAMLARTERYLPGVPHLYVNRPQVSGTVKLVINGIPNSGLTVILPAMFKNVSIAAKEAIILV